MTTGCKTNPKVNKANLNGWALPKEAIFWILEKIEPGKTIVELGSGTGTIELLKYYNVYSIEQNREYLHRTKSIYIYAPLVPYPNNLPGTKGWYNTTNFYKLPIDYDLLIIDGPAGIDRINILNFISLFKNDIPILIDDTQRKPDRATALELARLLNKNITEITGHQKKFIILY